MSEQFLVLASQVSILGGITVLTAFYTVIAILNVFAYTFTKSTKLYHMTAERTHGLRSHIVQARASKSNTKAIGA